MKIWGFSHHFPIISDMFWDFSNGFPIIFRPIESSTCSAPHSARTRARGTSSVASWPAFDGPKKGAGPRWNSAWIPMTCCLNQGKIHENPGDSPRKSKKKMQIWPLKARRKDFTSKEWRLKTVEPPWAPQDDTRQHDNLTNEMITKDADIHRWGFCLLFKGIDSVRKLGMRHHLHPFTSIYWFHPTFVLQKFGCALGLHHQRVPVEPVWPASIWLRQGPKISKFGSLSIGQVGVYQENRMCMIYYDIKVERCAGFCRICQPNPDPRLT